MKLMALPKEFFQIEEKVDFNVDLLYSKYGHVEIFDLLKQNISNIGIILSEIKVNPKSDRYSHEFNAFCKQEIENCYYGFIYTLVNSTTLLEQKKLLDLALEQPDLRFAAILLSNPKIQLTKEEVKQLLDSSSVNVSLKEKIIENVNIQITQEQLNNGILNSGYGFDVLYAARCDNRVLETTIEKLISRNSISSEKVLIQLLKNKNLIFNESQVNYFMTSDNLALRVECARNYQLKFSEEHIQNGFECSGFEEDDFDSYEESYTDSQLVEAFLGNPHIVLNDELINNIIFNNDKQYHMQSLLERENLFLNKYQIDKVIDNKDISTLQILKKQQLDDNQILKVLYMSNGWATALAENYLIRKDVKISDVVLSVLKISDNKEIRKWVEDVESSIKSNKLKI